jgi:site-specific DNA-methyltransferase (adenine-specific)
MTSFADQPNPPPENIFRFLHVTAWRCLSLGVAGSPSLSFSCQRAHGNQSQKASVVTGMEARILTADALPYRRKEVIGSCELYLADCAELLPHIGKVDHCITDPPYSETTKANARTHRNKSFLDKEKASYIPFAVTQDFITDVFRVIAGKARRWFVASMDFRHVARLEMQPPGGMRFIRVGAWVKNNSAPQFTGDRPAQGFEAIAIMHREGERLRWNGGGSRGVWITDVERNNGHPTPKPLSLINDWILKFTDEGETVLDPFMGSGTTLVSCLNLGRKAVGIEVNEDFFNLACKRVEAAYAQGNLFTPPAQGSVTQESLL